MHKCIYKLNIILIDIFTYIFIRYYRVDVTVIVNALSGYSSEVHGTIHIAARHMPVIADNYTLNNSTSISTAITNATAVIQPQFKAQNILGNNQNQSKYYNKQQQQSSASVWEQTLLFKTFETSVKCSVISKLHAKAH